MAYNPVHTVPTGYSLVLVTASLSLKRILGDCVLVQSFQA